jgi:hypothetical protein
MAVLLAKHRNKWENTLHMDGYYVVGVIAIPLPEFGYIITIVSKEEKTYLWFVVDNPQCTYP